jgi:hypothetical protein
LAPERAPAIHLELAAAAALELNLYLLPADCALSGETRRSYNPNRPSMPAATMKVFRDASRSMSLRASGLRH